MSGQADRQAHDRRHLGEYGHVDRTGLKGFRGWVEVRCGRVSGAWFRGVHGVISDFAWALGFGVKTALGLAASGLRVFRKVGAGATTRPVSTSHMARFEHFCWFPCASHLIPALQHSTNLRISWALCQYEDFRKLGVPYWGSS